MSIAAPKVKEAAFDVVGRYNQDQINGFPESLIQRMIELSQPTDGAKILELMAGDGNLTARIVKYCKERNISPLSISMLEFSKVQTEFAQMELANTGAEVIWGDVLSLTSLTDGTPLPKASFDRVLIKSANHEIRVDLQEKLYQNIFELLKPGGLFINLGFVFEDSETRDELRMIARSKDTLAGMHAAVANRHFLTRAELYGHLNKVGFQQIESGEKFFYAISSKAVAGHYFSGSGGEQFDFEFQSSQAKAKHMRRRGWITFEGDSSLMRGPGEITIARKPSPKDGMVKIFREYPYELVRSIDAHRQMINETVSHLPHEGSVLDLGCGIGLLAERLTQSKIRYEGFDLSGDHIALCRERLGHAQGFSFNVADVNELMIPSERYHAAALINLIYIAGIAPIPLLKKVYESLKPGGKIIVSGPTSVDSFKNAEPHILAQLEKDGISQGREAQLRAIAQANAALVTAKSNYWSVEGMMELLRAVGFSIVSGNPSHYYGNAYLVVGQKE